MHENDIAIRYRGDEYAAILVDTNRDEAIERAKHISRAFKSMDLGHLTGGESLSITVSIGIALYPEQNNESSEMVTRAHQKMLKAREKGGNRISL